MGGAATKQLILEQDKPTDASDIPNGNWIEAKNEVIRLRQLMAMVDLNALPQNSGSQLKRDRSVDTEEENRQLVKRSPRGDISNIEYTGNSTGGYLPGATKFSASGSLGSTDPYYETYGTESAAKGESREGAEYWRGDRDGSAYSRSAAFTPKKPGGKAKVLLEQINTKIYERYDGIKAAFLKLDHDKSGYISREEFRTAMANMGLPMTDEEFELVDQCYPHQESFGEEDKGISYLEFSALLSDQLNYVPGSGEDTPSGNYFGLTTTNSAHYMAPSPKTPSSTSRPKSKGVSQRTKGGGGSVDKMQDIFCKKVFSTFSSMKKAFQTSDRDGSGYIEFGEFKKLLTDHLGLKLDDDSAQELLGLFDTDGDGRLNYSEFVKCLHTY